MALTEHGDSRPGETPVRNGTSGLPDFTYDTGVETEDDWKQTTSTLRITAARPEAARPHGGRDGRLPEEGEREAG